MNFKKSRIAKVIGAASLAALMAVGSFATVFAATPTAADNKTITFASTQGATGTFKGYQLLKVVNFNKGDTTTPMKDVVYAVADDSVTTFFSTTGVGGKAGYSLDADMQILKGGKKITTDATETKALATLVAKAVADGTLTLPTVSTTVSGGKQSVTTAPGYYVFVETPGTDGEGTQNGRILTKPMLVNLIANKNSTVKDDKINLTKKIVEDAKRVDASTADNTDDVKYEVKSAIPNYAENTDFTKVVYSFADTFDGLTYKANSMVVTVGGTKVDATNYTFTPATNNKSFTLSFKADYLKTNQGKAVQLNYTGTMDSPNVTDTARPNSITLTYSNNPTSLEETGTLSDNVTTYTSKFDILKLDKNNAAIKLAGAQFTIAKDGAVLKFRKVVGTDTAKTVTYVYDKAGTVTTVESDANGTIRLDGLADGKYTVTETKAPAGYAKLTTPFTVTATAAKNAGGEPTGVFTHTSATTTFSSMKGTTLTVLNQKGVSLPETGATTAIVLAGVGTLIVAGGAVFMILSKKKKNASK